MANRKDIQKELLDLIKRIDESEEKDPGFDAIAGILTTLTAAMTDDIELMELTKVIFKYVEKRTGKDPTFLPPNQN